MWVFQPIPAAAAQQQAATGTLKTANGIAKAVIKKKNGLVIASIKTMNGLTP